MKIYLADTLESPNAKPPGGLTLTYKALTQEHEAARKVKNEGEILVCLGNPPYDRGQRSDSDAEKLHKGGWVRYGDQTLGGADAALQGNRPIFDDFLDPAKKAGKGMNLQVIFNDYVYFWRWALWRLFEQQACGGIVSFITASSYLSGPGFVGVREVMRQTFDDLWIIDLGGDNLGARKTPNVFNIQTPVAIAIGIRSVAANTSVAANVLYAKIEGETREDKLSQLAAIEKFDDLSWLKCSDDWHAALRPERQGGYFEWPRVTQLFPFHTAGAVFYRSWPIAEAVEVLAARWDKLRRAPASERKALFKESRDRKASYRVNKSTLPGYGQPAIASLTEAAVNPKCINYGFRAYDRQFAYYDSRLGDYIRPTLNSLWSDVQTFLVVPDSLVTGLGQSIAVSASIPDQHYFRGSFGGRDIIPLYRDALGEDPNITVGLLDLLANEYKFVPNVEDLASYVYAMLGNQTYTERFWAELETPGPRVPITRDGSIFRDAAALGRRLIWLQTYCSRFRGEGHGDQLPAGHAKSITGVSPTPSSYPDDFEYDPSTRELRVGTGRFGPIEPAVWEFEVSGMMVVQSWLGYRMKVRAGKKSSPLDDIRPQAWTPRMTDDLLELLWVVEATLAMEPALAVTLAKVVAGPCFTMDDLPTPTDAERKVGGDDDAGGDLLELMELPEVEDGASSAAG